MKQHAALCVLNEPPKKTRTREIEGANLHDAADQRLRSLAFHEREACSGVATGRRKPPLPLLVNNRNTNFKYCVASCIIDTINISDESPRPRAEGPDADGPQ
jgi:hypothetical protein